ncbi:unnamed protein product [Cuscuta epithymum]|uniref:Secreted protein n=1 Tax=Cuscuta epithymum TaxID=186058 RepID=A0AAV0DL26_9ASTE|nr:unnamed protein product [Cuscuta epithymum]
MSNYMQAMRMVFVIAILFLAEAAAANEIATPTPTPTPTPAPQTERGGLQRKVDDEVRWAIAIDNCIERLIDQTPEGETLTDDKIRAFADICTQTIEQSCHHSDQCILLRSETTLNI